ncbi:MAG TPA: pimeloyl-ACP methyl ester esterase BioH [Thiobacillaceae bacterium]|nr:pimeloyl-ACP methyl ester esterase BioH [Thiobacillaceae bacterium]HNU64821.1 pimeloyl-ACP methyl ester esterase BioH [Thiobacillaceae bacterium]
MTRLPSSLATLYLHGWGLHGGIWDGMRAVLPGRAADLPGYGDTPAPTPYTAETLADALAADLDAPVHLLGWSMGGMVAQALAARHPDKVARLVLVGSSPAFVNRADWSSGLAPRVLAGFAHDLARDHRATLLRFLALQARGGDAARAVVGRLRTQVFARGEPALAALTAGLELLRAADLRHLAGHIGCPVLVVHGAHDTLCPVEAGHWLASRIPGARMALHPGAAHAPFISHPDWFADVVGGFLHARSA